MSPVANNNSGVDDVNRPFIPIYLSQRTLELIRSVADDKAEPIDYTIRKLVLFYIEYRRTR